jgi:hypothetical protein
MNTQKKYGLIIDKQKPEDYVLGSGMIGTKEINPNADWSGFLPKNEYQNLNGVETMSCVTFATHNCIEILMNFLFQKEDNFSERFTSILSGTSRNGNSPQTVIQSIRNNGLILETELPFDDKIDSWDKFFSPNPMDRKYLKEGLKWLEKYDLSHEWVFSQVSQIEKHKLISEALKRSPVGISVYAWGQQDENGVYHQDGQDNHFVCCYSLDEKGNYKIFDSYDNSHKIYSFDANISMAKLYWIAKKNGIKKGWFEVLLDFISNLIKK